MKTKNTTLFYSILTIILLFVFFPKKITAQTTSPMVWYDLMSNPANIQLLNIPFDSIEVQLSTHEKVRHLGRLRPRFVDQLLEVREQDYKQRFLPASRILGFSNGGDYYRTVRLKHRYYVFAKKIVTGKMSLYRGDDYVSGAAADIDIMSNDGYQNTLLIGNGGTLENFNHSDLYFIALEQDTSKIEQVNPSSFGESYLRQTPKSYRLMQQYRPRGKATRRILESATFLSGIAYLLMRDEINANIAVMLRNEKNPAPNYLGGILLGTVVSYVTYRFMFKSKKLTPAAMKSIIELHNQELLSR